MLSTRSAPRSPSYRPDNPSDRKLLYYAMRQKDAHMSARLLQRVNVNETDDMGLSPAHVAVQSHSTPILRLVVDAKADLNIVSHPRFGGFAPLHLAVQQNDLAMATLLVELGANPNQPSAKGCTPMHEAAKFSSEHVTQMLLAAGGNARQLDSHGYTPNSYATHVGNSDVSRILPDDQTTSWDHFKTTLDYRERLHILNMRGGTKKKKGGKKGKKKKK